MPTLDLGPPPALGVDAQYEDYRPWLERAFYMRICAYCLIRNPHLHIDHYEPQKYAPSRLHDPTNLLLGCSSCNGKGGKSDYHPNHSARKRLPKDTSGHLVIDVRADDFAQLFEISAEGKIRARPGPFQQRAAWNIVVLNLRREVYDKIRKENLDDLATAERIVKVLDSGAGGDKRAVLEEFLAGMVIRIARGRPFFDALGIAITPALMKRVEAVRAQELQFRTPRRRDRQRVDEVRSRAGRAAEGRAY